MLSPISLSLTALAIMSCSADPGDGSDTQPTEDAGTTSSSDTSPPVGDTTEASTGASDAEVEPSASCRCVLPDHAELDSYDHQACGWGPCGSIEVACQGGSEHAPHPLCDAGYGELVMDITALDCALDMLVQGASGLVHFTFSADRGVSRSGGFLRIGAGRLGLSRTWQSADLGGFESALELIPLKSAAYFETCRAMQDPAERYLCLKKWSDGSATEVCDESMQYSDL
ncbi:hypothetical protein [Nannocystis bainbridge]|uniref:Lipoprotein n=1 Tax=Nannocystis bainbridge TaxID=2995303 RepID=A0ABT5DUF1_9BACT|nr:hypothetical protein [Nannocystis bainbridge]MDC0717186.1 hypothetical protein [Nannocystis bainbridge]